MVAIVTFGVVLAALQLATIADIRASRAAWQKEWETERQQWLADSRQQLAAWEADSRRLRGDTRSDPTSCQREIQGNHAGW